MSVSQKQLTIIYIFLIGKMAEVIHLFYLFVSLQLCLLLGIRQNVPDFSVAAFDRWQLHVIH